MLISYDICDFTKPDQLGNYVDRGFEEILTSERMIKSLKNGNMIGAISHSFREKYVAMSKSDPQRKLPQSDLLLKNGEAANVCKKLWIEDDKLKAELSVFSVGNGKFIQDLISKDKFIPQVSIATNSVLRNGRYFIKSINGIDFTMDPALDTEVLSVNFSTKQDLSESPLDDSENFLQFLGDKTRKLVESDGTLELTSAKGSILEGILDEEPRVKDGDGHLFLEDEIRAAAKEGQLNNSITTTELDSLNEDMSEEELNGILNNTTDFCDSYSFSFTGQSPSIGDLRMVNFNLLEYVRLRKRTPRQTFLLMIQNFVNYINAKNPKVLREERDIILEYLRSYLYTWITGKMNEPKPTPMNISLMLGIAQFCDRKAIIDFQRISNLVSRQLATQHTITVPYQKELGKVFGKLYESLIETVVNRRIRDPEKKKIFTEEIFGGAT